MPRVYIETTIPSFYFETRVAPHLQVWRRVTRDWWAAAPDMFELCTSEFVIRESQDSPRAKADAIAGLLKGIPRLPILEDVEEVAEYYIKHRVMPKGSGGDAVHVAMCALHAVDYLLTWNIRHLANPAKFEHLRHLNTRLGLATPMIITPLGLMAPPQSSSGEGV
jgi:predicted nucleic acid-binding protein